MEVHQHLILEAAHPAAEMHNPGAGFLGCKHFTKANEFIKNKKKPDDKSDSWIQPHRLAIGWHVHNSR
jgi:uracil DNA glycosylase